MKIRAFVPAGETILAAFKLVRNDELPSLEKNYERVRELL